MPGSADEGLEAADDWVCRISPAGKRKVGGRPPVERAEAAHPVRAEALGPAPCRRNKPAELDPIRPSFGKKAIEFQSDPFMVTKPRRE